MEWAGGARQAERRVAPAMHAFAAACANAFKPSTRAAAHPPAHIVEVGRQLPVLVLQAAQQRLWGAFGRRGGACARCVGACALCVGAVATRGAASRRPLPTRSPHQLALPVAAALARRAGAGAARGHGQRQITCTALGFGIRICKRVPLEHVKRPQ